MREEASTIRAADRARPSADGAPPRAPRVPDAVAADERGGAAHTRRSSSWPIDLAVVVLIALVTYALSAHYDLAEALRHLTEPHERLQLDELPVVMLTAALGMVWFSWRRYRETRRELSHRHQMEVQLAATLADNLRLARHFVDAQEAERRSLARELHDELGQYLNAIKLDAVAIARGSGQVPLSSRAEDIVDSVDHVHGVVQTLIHRFRPVALDELGLEAALEHSVDHWRGRLAGTVLHLATSGDLEHCGERANLAAYRIVQEGLTNVSRHARAAHVRIRVDRHVVAELGRDELHLLVEDDGVGTDLRARTSGLGLVGMRERAEMLGGRFRASSVPGRGFTLRVALPVTPMECLP